MPLIERTPEEGTAILAKYRKNFTPEDLIEHADFDGRFVPLDDVIANAEAVLRQGRHPCSGPESVSDDRSMIYRLGATGSAEAAFVNIVAQATSISAGEAVLRAMKEIGELLRTDPNGFGRSMYHLRQLKTRIKHAVVGPLYIEFGVYDVELAAVISCVCLLADSPNG